jgi:PAS domain S-box-containing protein
VSHRLKTRSPYLIIGFGAVLFFITVVHHVSELYTIDGFVGPLVALLLDGLLALGLVYAGYWLDRTELSTENRWQVCVWCFVGAVLFFTIMGVSLLIGAFEGRIIAEALFPLLIATEAGGIAGVTAGYQTARARAQAHRAQTASETLRERTRQLQGVLDSVGAAIWIRDTDSHFVLVNQEFRTLFGIDEKTAVAGQPPEAVLPAEATDHFRENDQRVLETKQPVETEETVETQQGIKTFLTRRTPLFEGEDLYATCGIASDITEQKEYERTIEQQNERLDQFASVVSHDLRNPLNVIDGRLELAREECNSEHLKHISRALDRMEALIEDLLTLARSDDPVTDPSPTDLAAIVSICWRNIDTADATLVTDVDRAIHAEESRLKQLFENLVRNAVEHGGDDVTIIVGELPDGFYVEDDGPGIPEGERHEVFDAGYSTNDEGTGFGLNIVKQVADAHDWRVRITESSEGGARFEITGVDSTDE